MLSTPLSHPNSTPSPWSRYCIQYPPKTPRKECTRDNRIRIQTLYFDAGFIEDQIALQLNLTPQQVQYALANRLTPQKHLQGRKPFLNTPQRKRLVEWVTYSSANRRIRWANIPPILGWDCGEKAFRAAFKREGLVRRIARQKPPLTEQHRKDRLKWAWSTSSAPTSSGIRSVGATNRG